MPYRKEQFINGEIYHIVLRAIDNNLIFKDQDDYYRAIFSIYEFNNAKAVEIKKRRYEIQSAKENSDGGPSSAINRADKREHLVELLGFCFMPNHIHLLMEQLKDGGIIKFMSKLGTGYGGYFNRKYGRRGHVFQDRFLSACIEDEDQFKNVFVYIHTNPLSLIEPLWKEEGIKDFKNAINFLNGYRWSSYQDYLGKNNFPFATERNVVRQIMGVEKGCEEFVNYWVKYKNKIKGFKIFLD